MGDPIPRLRRDGEEGGVRRRGGVLHGDSGGRGGAREEVQEAAGEREEGHRLQTGRRGRVEVQELRLRAPRQGGAGGMPSLQASAELLRDSRKELLAHQSLSTFFYQTPRQYYFL